MLGAQLLLCHGSVRRRRHSLTLFFVLSMAALLLYWLWFAYLKYGKQERPVKRWGMVNREAGMGLVTSSEIKI